MRRPESLRPADGVLVRVIAVPDLDRFEEQEAGNIAVVGPQGLGVTALLAPADRQVTDEPDAVTQEAAQAGDRVLSSGGRSLRL